MKIIRLIEAVITVVRQALCRHKNVSVLPHANMVSVLIMCKSCGKFTFVENPGKYWCILDLVDRYLRNKS